MSQVDVRKTKNKSGLRISRELKSGEPVLGAQGPDGAPFLGWVVVQVWGRGRGTGTNTSDVTVNWSGDPKVVLQRASEELSKISGTI